MRLCIYCKSCFEDCTCDDKDYADTHDYSPNELANLKTQCSIEIDSSHDEEMEIP